MTDNEMRVAIAKMDGWVEVEPLGYSQYRCFAKSGVRRILDSLPDYLNSHDALAPVLAGLSNDEMHTFVGCLDDSTYPYAPVQGERILPKSFRLILATPRQKCEALLRVRGLTP